MKAILLSISVIFILFLSSCEKVIDVNLNDADRVYVIEGQITNFAGMNYVRVSKSDNFYQTQDFKQISGATVSVSDEIGNLTVFTESEPGLYVSNSFTANSYTTYNLSVLIGTEEITATTYMPGNTMIDSIPYRENQGGFFGDGYTAFLYWTDDANEENYYRYKNYKKSITDLYFTPDESISITEDALFNGIGTGIPLFSRNFDLGDTVIVDLMEIDKHNYKYWYALSQVNSGQSAAPGNPVSNLSGDALGYFGAYNVSRDTIVIQ